MDNLDEEPQGFEKTLFDEAWTNSRNLSEFSRIKVEEENEDVGETINNAMITSFYVGFELALKVVLINPTYANFMHQLIIDKVYKGVDSISHQLIAGRLVEAIAAERRDLN